jgi:hypothetical protein
MWGFLVIFIIFFFFVHLGGSLAYFGLGCRFVLVRNVVEGFGPFVLVRVLVLVGVLVS